MRFLFTMSSLQERRPSNRKGEYRIRLAAVVAAASKIAFSRRAFRPLRNPRSSN
jgi:hypothetical protein